MADRLDESPATDKEVRLFRQLFFSQTEEVEVDGQGRNLLPDRLIELGGLKHEVILLGVRDRMELWDARAGTSTSAATTLPASIAWRSRRFARHSCQAAG